VSRKSRPSHAVPGSGGRPRLGLRVSQRPAAIMMPVSWAVTVEIGGSAVRVRVILELPTEPNALLFFPGPGLGRPGPPSQAVWSWSRSPGDFRPGARPGPRATAYDRDGRTRSSRHIGRPSHAVTVTVCGTVGWPRPGWPHHQVVSLPAAPRHRPPRDCGQWPQAGHRVTPSRQT
jgi:hypothetical protein